MNTSQDAILSAIAQHAAYSYRLSSGEVSKLISLFNGESNAMVSKLRDLLDELSDAERVALSGGQYTTPLPPSDMSATLNAKPSPSGATLLADRLGAEGLKSKQ